MSNIHNDDDNNDDDHNNNDDNDDDYGNINHCKIYFLALAQ